MNRPAYDAITLEVLWQRLISAADEAAKTLKRVSFSTLVNESNDFACVLTDAAGRSLVQNTESIPSFNGCLPVTVRHFIDEIGIDNMAPGDFLICNTPWVATGHLNDITISKPIFVSGRLVAFAVSTAHAPDIGGKVRSVVSREIYEEGFHIPAMKLIEAGQPDQTLLKLLRTAVRTPEQTEGDIWAQVTALNLMDQRIQDLLAEYALPDLTTFGSEIHERSATAMRQAIRDLPDGTYEYGFETDGFAEPLQFHVTVTVADDKIHVDYTGCSEQIDHAVNCVLTYSFAMTSYALKCALLPDVANNDGIFRCIEVTAPRGTIVNPIPPVAMGGRMAVGHYLPTLVFGALAPVLGERVMAASGAPLWSIIQTGIDDEGRSYANTWFFNGGMGATALGPGESCFSWPSNISNVPIELVERNSPMLVTEKALRAGSGGSGQSPGGDGQILRLECLSETPVGIIFMAERCKYPAPGLTGGGDGAKGEVLIDDKPADYRKDHILSKGQTIVLKTPGGGGFGISSDHNEA